jgi:osmoprotectant transport system ATP-binding protein
VTEEPAPQTPMIVLEGVSRSYGTGVRAVTAVSLAVHAREFVAIIGGSGSGKTTLLKMMNRLLEPDVGAVRIGGQDAREVAPHLLRRRIGYVFQQIGLFPHLNVAENIAITPRLLGWPAPRILDRTVQLMMMVGLPESLLPRMPEELSGGQQQRVGVARALAAEPPVVLMDEPFGALDPMTRDTLGREYRKLHDQIHLTTLMVTHDVMEAVLLSDRILIMHEGAIIADGSPHELLSQDADLGVRALMEMPRRQAERITAMLAEKTRRG